jgi:hypothetical protein
MTAFNLCDGLLGATIRNGVLNIDDLAFSLCSCLSAVKIGNGVTRVGAEAFFGKSLIQSDTFV